MVGSRSEKTFMAVEHNLAMVGKKSRQSGHVSCSSLLGNCKLCTS